MYWSFVLALLSLTGCGYPDSPRRSEITVAAAANLAGAFDEVGAAFTDATGTEVTLSYASTAQLAQQIENSAPFDVFASADVAHVDALVNKGKITPGSRAIYARGVLALWIPKGEQISVRSLQDLAAPSIRSIAVATPSVAPYGNAAVEALQNSSLWTQLEPKVVYSTNINMAKQFAATGNADAAFTAYSLVLNEAGTIVRVDASLYTPIEQAVGLVQESKNQDLAKQFISFLVSNRGQDILRKFGYLIPKRVSSAPGSR
jgi:molybdate transport system substrate-binding protein